MKKFLFVLMGVFVIAGAFAAGENIPTSKSYVDSKMAEKQDTIPANDGTVRVLTNTGTAGEYGTKGIYDSTGEYAVQQNNLVDAATMNAGVQNAINSEFQCIEWANPNDHTSDCLLMDVFGTTVNGGTTLPNGYTVLEYIESTGTQWIDTGIAPTVIFEIYLDGMITASGYGRKVFGTSTGSIDVNIYSNTTLASCLTPSSCSNGGIGFGGINNKFHIGLSPNWKLNYNGTKTILERSYTPSGTFSLFATTPTSTHAIGRIYGAKLYNNGNLAFSGIPALRDSDSVVGMYDTVTNTFFTNSGTGEFIAGPVVNLYLPAGN